MSVNPPSLPLTQGLLATRSRGVSDETIFTTVSGDVLIPASATADKYTYINVNNGLLYYYTATDSKLHINDNEITYTFDLDASQIVAGSTKIRVVKYYGQYYFYYISKFGNTVNLKRYDPSANTVYDTGVSSYHPFSSNPKLYDARLEIVNDLLLFGTQRTNDSGAPGKLHCIQSNHTVLRSHSDSSINMWNSFVSHQNNIVVCDTISGNAVTYGNIVYKPVSQLGLSGGWISISPPSAQYKITNLQRINGELYATFYLPSTNYYEIYRLSNDYATWFQLGQEITRADSKSSSTIYGELKYIGFTLYLFPINESDYIYKYATVQGVGTRWLKISHPTDSTFKIMLDLQDETTDKTIKQRGSDLYFLSKIDLSGADETSTVITKISGNGAIAILPTDINASQPAVNDFEFIDGKSYIAQHVNLLQLDGSGEPVKRDLVFSDPSHSLLSINYYLGKVYVSYSSGRIARANLITGSAIKDAIGPIIHPSVVKSILSSAQRGFVTIEDVDARSLFSRTDMQTAGLNIDDYRLARFMAFGGPVPVIALPYQRYPPISSNVLNNTILYIPFDTTTFILTIDGIDYKIELSSFLPPLKINDVTIPLGGLIPLGGRNYIFGSRGSITLVPANRNTIPLHLGSGLYNCYDDTIIYTKQTVYNLRDGKTLPSQQGRFLAKAGNILRDIGETVNIFTSSVGAGGRVTRRLRFVFRLVQVVNGGAATEGVSGAPVDDYLSGFICTWAETGRLTGGDLA